MAAFNTINVLLKCLAIVWLWLIGLSAIVDAANQNMSSRMVQGFLSSWPCSWILPFNNLTEKCLQDVRLYKKQICEPSSMTLDNLWAYKSRFTTIFLIRNIFNS